MGNISGTYEYPCESSLHIERRNRPNRSTPFLFGEEILGGLSEDEEDVPESELDPIINHNRGDEGMTIDDNVATTSAAESSPKKTPNDNDVPESFKFKFAPKPTLAISPNRARTPLQCLELFITFVNEIVEQTNRNIERLKAQPKPTSCSCHHKGMQDKKCKNCNLVIIVDTFLNNSNLHRKCFHCKLWFCDRNMGIFCQSCFEECVEHYGYPTYAIELNALFGILYAIGQVGFTYSDIQSIFKDETNFGIVSLTMSVYRFCFLMYAIRFDNVDDRVERKLTDKLAPIRKISDEFNDNLMKTINPGQDCLFGETFTEFDGKCSFKQPFANQSSKVGIKLYSIVDQATGYILRMEPDHCGQQTQSNTNTNQEVVFKRLTEFLQYSGRTITTMGIRYSSYQLALEMLRRRTTIVAMISHSAKEIPASLKKTSKRSSNSVSCAFRLNTTLLSFVSSQRKNCILLSTLHHNRRLLDNGTPEMINYFKKSRASFLKVGRDCLEYDVSRKCHRWTLAIFFFFLNTAAYNAWIVFKLSRSGLPTSASDADLVKSRYRFHQNLINSLTLPYLYVQSFHRKIPSQVLANFKPSSIPNIHQIAKSICRQKRDRPDLCDECSKFICSSHPFVLCDECNFKDRYGNKAQPL